jgi:transcriptional regulator with XRE-family HTH domain
MDSEIPSEPLGSKVRRMRVERGLGQERLALLARIDQSGLSKFERNSRPIGEASLRKIAQVLEIPLERLLEDTDYEPKGSSPFS